MNKKRFAYDTRPKALIGNVIQGKKYRFTFLTSSLIRLEYSENGIFEDRASQTVFFRDFEKVKFNKQISNKILTVETDNLALTYKEDEKFSNKSLCIKLKIEPASTWNYGDDYEQLFGTAKTLDSVNGEIPLEPGVCSRNGFSIIDDSNTLLLNNNGWVEVRNDKTIDVYFFGYGYNYLQSVKDFYRLTGAPPMLPAYALGNWWSRYHKYTQDEYQNLILEFEKRGIPFSVSVVDMDWHLTNCEELIKQKQNKYIEKLKNSGASEDKLNSVKSGFKRDAIFSSGWTGYTWNDNLFPDYKKFLQFLKSHNLKTALNLHPAGGVGCYEKSYKQMAEACGIDPETQERVHFNVLSESFMENYFDILHHPYEKDGVDFWWMDWQQGTSYWWIHDENKDGNMQDKREILDPLWMLNHLHIADITRDGKRPMFFSRYSGPGSHRYPVGFSGDTVVTWESLNFQPYFTATASNIGYSWWSHDIGGHFGGYRDDELTVRWIQLGLYSPINRLHSTDSEFVRKEPWCYENKYEKIITECLKSRHKLFPYIYTMNYRNNKNLEPLVQPMYYSYPKSSAAYEVKNQFMFGSMLMVAPITSKNDGLTKMGSTDVWFPKGLWYDYSSGVKYYSDRNRMLKVHRTIDKYPVFVKGGAIVPMQESLKLNCGNDLKVIIFPGSDGVFTLYEDTGEGSDYKKGICLTTRMTLKWSQNPEFTVEIPKGDISIIPKIRNWKFVFRGFSDNINITAFVNNKEIKTEINYNVETYSYIVGVRAGSISEIKIKISGEDLVAKEPDYRNCCVKILQQAQISVDTKILLEGIIKNNDLSLNQKIKHIKISGAIGPGYKDLISAITEQISLVDISDKFTYNVYEI